MPDSNGASDASHATNGTYANRVHHDNSYNIPMNDEYAYKPRKLQVVTIGAGFSGLLIAHKFQHRFPEM